MTLAEFKAWFDGFTESMEGVPSDKQWERIKARVAEIDNKPVTYPVFVDRYRPYWLFANNWPTHGTQMLCSSMSTAGDIGALSQNAGAVGARAMTAESHASLSGVKIGRQRPSEFDSSAAMLDLGKAEFSSIAA